MNIDDIVVCIDSGTKSGSWELGLIHKIKSIKTLSGDQYFTSYPQSYNTTGIWLSSVRPARKEEIEFYNNGGTNIKELSSKIMPFENLVEGEIYFHACSYSYIFTYRNYGDSRSIGYKNYISVSSKTFTKSEGHNAYGGSTTELRRATEEEIQWLKVCLSAGKFVSKEESIRLSTVKDSLQKKDLIPGEIYFFSCPDWSSDYVEGYDINGKYPTIYKSKNSSSGWVFSSSFYISSYSSGRAGFYCRKATEFEKSEFYKLMEQRGISIPKPPSESFKEGDFVIATNCGGNGIASREGDSELCRIVNHDRFYQEASGLIKGDDMIDFVVERLVNRGYRRINSKTAKLRKADGAEVHSVLGWKDKNETDMLKSMPIQNVSFDTFFDEEDDVPIKCTDSTDKINLSEVGLIKARKTVSVAVNTESQIKLINKKQLTKI